MKNEADNFQQIEDGSIDAGLLLLSRHPMADSFTFEQIAYVCGCSKANIQRYESNGLKKLKAAFEKIGAENLI
jgi:hypothetical protein